MGLNFFAISLTIITNLFYHLLLKLTPNNVNPILSLAVTYLTAMLVCIIIFPFFKNEENIIFSLKQVNWTSIALGIAIVGLEMGFLLAYRGGWNISLTAIISSSAVTLLLIPIGIFLFKESVTISNLVGILLCISGLYLINIK